MMLLLVCRCGIDAQLSAASQHGTSSSEIGDYPGASLRKSRRNRKLDEVRQPCKIGEWHAERVRGILTCGYSLGRRFRDPICLPANPQPAVAAPLSASATPQIAV